MQEIPPLPEVAKSHGTTAAAGSRSPGGPRRITMANVPELTTPHREPAVSLSPRTALSQTRLSSSRLESRLATIASKLPTLRLPGAIASLGNLLPGAFRSPVIEGVRHYPGLPIVGKGLEVLTSGTFDDFIKRTLAEHDESLGTSGTRNYEAATFHLLDKPCALIMDVEDHRHLCRPETLTKLGPNEHEAGPLGTGVEHLFGHSNLVLMDAFTPDGNKNKDYWRQLNTVMSHLVNDRKIENYAKTRAPLVDGYLDQVAINADSCEISSLLLPLTMDFEGGFLGFERVRPSSFLSASPDNKDFFVNMLAEITHPLMALQPQRLVMLMEKGDDKIIEYGSMMMEGNWGVFRDAIENNESNLIVDLFEKVTFQQKFPIAHSDFKKLGQDSPTKMMDFMRKIYAMQVVAGEYTAPVVDFGIREIFNRKDVLSRMRAELDGLVLSDVAGGNHWKCPYSYAVALEVMRLYPPVGIQPARLNKDITEEVGGQVREIKKGTLLLFHLKRLNESMEATRFTTSGEEMKPTDFYPERYLSLVSGSDGPNKFLASLRKRPDRLHTFAGSYGKFNRICPAHRFVINEIFMMLAAFAKYDLAAKDKDGNTLEELSCEEHTPATTRPRHPVYYTLKSRQGA